MSQKLRTDPKDDGRTAIRISREYNFPRELVFNMLTDPKKGAVSWSPEEAVNLVFELDLRPGGAIRIHDRDREGNVHKTSGTVVEIAVPELLVVKTATAPSTGTAPWEALQTLKFEELSPTRTRVTILVKVLATGSFPGDVESLEEGFQGGWREVLDKLQRSLN